MMFRNRISIFVATFLIIGFFFLTLPEKGYSGMPAIGCCRTEMDGGECVGCESGCLTSDNFCTSQGGFNDLGTCFDDGGGATCQFVVVGPVGCCVIEPGDCRDGLLDAECFEGFAGAEIWIIDESCSNVPRCTEAPVTTNVPTLSEWGLIAMAGVLGIIGFMVIRRRQATA